MGARECFVGSRWRQWPLAILILFCSVEIIFSCLQTSESADSVGVVSTVLADSNEPLQPIQARVDLDHKKVVLGQRLFGDPQLSHDNRIACTSCHDLRRGGTDRRARSVGIRGALGVINAPTVFNSGLNFSQFWDGRVETLENQVDEPILSRIEMSSTWLEVIGKLEKSPEYVRSFRAIYSNGIQKENVRDSIAEFERSLSTPNSRFDRYLRHDIHALNTREQDGYKLFKSLGCSSCHQGANIGGNMYQKLGIMAPYFTDRGGVTVADRGRFNVTGDPKDLYMFKVPSLRNVALTAPYFHDGTAATLTDAVRIMAKYQLGHPLSNPDIELIVAFLETLTGELNGKLL